jgi:hypothetical protein
MSHPDFSEYRVPPVDKSCLVQPLSFRSYLACVDCSLFNVSAHMLMTAAEEAQMRIYLIHSKVTTQLS